MKLFSIFYDTVITRFDIKLTSTIAKLDNLKLSEEDIEKTPCYADVSC